MSSSRHTIEHGQLDSVGQVNLLAYSANLECNILMLALHFQAVVAAAGR